MNRKTVLGTLLKYFEEKGEVFTAQEYLDQTDKPVRMIMVKRYWGSWNRVMGAAARHFAANPLKTTKVESKKKEAVLPENKATIPNTKSNEIETVATTTGE